MGCFYEGYAQRMRRTESVISIDEKVSQRCGTFLYVKCNSREVFLKRNCNLPYIITNQSKEGFLPGFELKNQCMRGFIYGKQERFQTNNGDFEEKY